MILSGGESLLDPVRERVTYKVIEALREKYAAQGGVKVVVQTTGDILTDAIVADLLQRGVWMISVASVDDFHVGLEGPAKQQAFMARLAALFERHGMRKSGLSATTRNWHEEPGPVYSFFGATPDSWIGKLWPRGRAWQNSLSHATLADNFCNRWSDYKKNHSTRLRGVVNFISDIAFSPRGDRLAAVVGTQVRIWELAKPENPVSFEEQNGFLRDIAWSPDGRKIVSGGSDRRVTIWDAENGEVLDRHTLHTNTVMAVAWSPDGKTIASGGTDQRLVLYDYTQPNPLPPL